MNLLLVLLGVLAGSSVVVTLAVWLTRYSARFNGRREW